MTLNRSSHDLVDHWFDFIFGGAFHSHGGRCLAHSGHCILGRKAFQRRLHLDCPGGVLCHGDGLCRSTLADGGALDAAHCHAPCQCVADALRQRADGGRLCASQSPQNAHGPSHGVVGQGLGIGALAGQWQLGRCGVVWQFPGVVGVQLQSGQSTRSCCGTRSAELAGCRC